MQPLLSEDSENPAAVDISVYRSVCLRDPFVWQSSWTEDNLYLGLLNQSLIKPWSVRGTTGSLQL